MNINVGPIPLSISLMDAPFALRSQTSLSIFFTPYHALKKSGLSSTEADTRRGQHGITSIIIARRQGREPSAHNGGVRGELPLLSAEFAG